MSERRYISPALPATPREDEVLKILAEECLEAAHRALKASRFGPTEVQPGQPRSNAYRLGHELGELLTMIDVAAEHGLVSTDALEAGREHKRRQLARFLQSDPDAVMGEGA